MENNKQVVVRFFEEVWNQRKLEIADDIFWLGIPPNGNRINIRMMTIHRISSGKIGEDWVIVESLGLFQQLGVLPETSELLREFRERKE